MADLSTLTTREYSQPVIRSRKSLRISEAIYWKKYYHHPDIIYEWKNGKLEEKCMADHLDYLMYKWFLKLLDEYLAVKPIAKITGLEIGFRLVLPDEVAIRRPDLGVVLHDNPIPLESTDKTYEGTFDICVESVSDSNEEHIKRDTVDKKQEYAKGGVQEYLILDASREYTAYYRLNAQGVYVPVKPTKQGVIKSKVLPGFQFRLEDLYNQPSNDKMIEDPVYQSFVSLGYQKERKARQKAEAQALKAEAQALEEKKARQEEKKARQKAEAQALKAEAQALEEKKARQDAENETKRLKAELARLQSGK